MIIKDGEKEEETLSRIKKKGEKLENIFKEKFKMLSLSEPRQVLHETSVEKRKDDGEREADKIKSKYEEKREKCDKCLSSV